MQGSPLEERPPLAVVVSHYTRKRLRWWPQAPCPGWKVLALAVTAATA